MAEQHQHEHDGHDHHHGGGHAHHDDDHHGHGHHGHAHAPASFGRAFAIGIAANLFYVAVEAGYGLAAHSLSLLADAGHNLGDVLGLAAAWAAAWLGQRRPGGRYTYGLRRSSILVALGNAVTLLIVTGGIMWEAARRLMAPELPGGVTIMVVAAIGIAVNGGTALLFMAGRKDDLNLRGAFAHMAADALVALGVVIAGALILVTGWAWLDPVVGLVVSVVIILGTWSLLRQSLDLALDAVPAGIDRAAVEASLAQLPSVTEIHDLHIWAMSTTETALTAHLVRPGEATDDPLLRLAAAEMKHRFGIGHCTFQVESGADDEPCDLAPDHVV
jgi:cobalt-zinc-cadmium efflux system protein